VSEPSHTETREPLYMLKAILRFGELANIDAGSPYQNYGGKKPPSKDVFCFPRHMLTDIEAVIAAAEVQS
jgi:hypothetical protein